MMTALTLALLCAWHIMQAGSVSPEAARQSLPQTRPSVTDLLQKTTTPTSKSQAALSDFLKPGVSTPSPDFHHLLAPEELMHYFGTTIRHEVPGYVLTLPRHVSGTRRRRGATLDKDKLMYHVTAFGQDYWIELQHNNKLMSSGCMVEEHINGTKRISPCFKQRFDSENSDNDCYYIGTSTTHSGSTVAVSTCYGLNGFISIPDLDHDLIIRPIKKEHSSLVSVSPKEGIPHLVFKRHVGRRLCAGPADSEKALSTNIRATRNEGSHALNRRASDDLYIEMMLVADKTLHQFHGSDLSNYLLTVGNVAAARMLDPTLGRSIHITVVKIHILDKDEPGLDIVEDATIGLKSFCDWQEKSNLTQHYDAAALLTRLDLTHGTSGRAVVGLANMRGMCVANRRCLYIEDTGVDTGLTLAHETGHSLGMGHDADSNSCPDLTNIMSSAGATGPSSLKWSACSRDALDAFISSGRAFCLIETQTQSVSLPKDLPGLVYDADDQCRLWAGTTYYEHEDPCGQLWCHDPKNIDGILKGSSPMMDGSTCGPRKYCLSAQCVDIGDNGPLPVDGGWSTWSSEWSECSRTCGGGVRTKVRQCNNPTPRLGGKYCVGSSRKVELCNVKLCSTSEENYKKEQCNATRDEPVDGLSYEWIPWDAPADLECFLMCKSQPDNRIFRRISNGSSFYKDGTSCKGDEKSNFYRCVQGSCQALGCDGLSDSAYQFDVCGVCGGSGDTCIKNSGTNTHGEAQKWTTIATFAVGTTGIQLINKNNFAKMTLSIGGKPIFNNDPSVNAATDTYTLQGVTFSYIRAVGLEAEQLSVPGPLQVEVAAQVFVVFDYPQFQPNIKYEFLVPRSNETLYVWKSETTGCNSECDNGNYKVEVTCQRKNDSSVVEDRFCNIFDKPDIVGGPCRTKACQPAWRVGLWGVCTKSCGGGVRTRQVTCVQHSGNQVITVQDDQCDTSQKPDVSRTCNVAACDAEWQTTDWSSCSLTCGRGVKTRQVTCMSDNKEVNVSSCRDAKPAATQTCVQGPCDLNIAGDHCKDVNPDCAVYDVSVCKDYESWARQNCMKTCAFCTVLEEHGQVTRSSETGSCQNKISDCVSYGKSVCSGEYAAWAKENCAEFCGFCTSESASSSLTTLPHISSAQTTSSQISSVETSSSQMLSEHTVSSLSSTLQPTCQDKSSDCASYGQSVCAGQYTNWAKENCAKFCDYCSSASSPLLSAPSSPPLSAPSSCADKNPSCVLYGQSVCVGTYADWARENCAKFCNQCGSTSAPSSTASSLSTSPLPSSLKNYDSSCQDKNLYCSAYGQNVCSGSHAVWAKVNCEKFCGYCKETSSSASPTSLLASSPLPNKSVAVCENKNSYCSMFGQTICAGDSIEWARENCAQSCGYCVATSSQSSTVSELGTAVSKDLCVDKEQNCFNYGMSICSGEYKDWASANCARFCRLC